MVKNPLLVFIILLICGCSSSNKIITSSPDEMPGVTGSVINSSSFGQGGSLVLKSFKAGTGAAADEQTDILSLSMMKGIQDALPSQGSHFTLQKGAQEEPDFYLDGYIEDYGREGQHVKLRKNEVFLSVDGEIWLRQTGEKIFVFQTSTVINLKTQDPGSVAYQIGLAIAHFIGTQH